MLKFLYIACIAILSLGQLANFSGLYLFDIFVGFYVVSGFSLLPHMFIPKKFTVFLLFLIWAGVTAVIFFVDLPSFFYLVRLLTYILAGLVTNQLVRNGVLPVATIQRVFAYSGIFIVIAGLVQLAVLPDFTELDPTLGWDPHKNRLASTFFDPNFTGAYLVLCFGMVTLNLRAFKKSELLIYPIILLTGIFLTFSRSSWGMFAVYIFIYGLFKSRFVLALSFIFAFLTYFAVPRVQTRLSGITDPQDSAAFRLDSWKNALVIYKENFWFGTGFNNFKAAQLRHGFITPDSETGHASSGSDSSILLVAATTGFVGLVLFLVSYLRAIKLSTNITIVGILLALLLQSQFINSLFYPQIMFILYAGFLVSDL